MALYKRTPSARPLLISRGPGSLLSSGMAFRSLSQAPEEAGPLVRRDLHPWLFLTSQLGNANMRGDRRMLSVPVP